MLHWFGKPGSTKKLYENGILKSERWDEAQGAVMTDTPVFLMANSKLNAFIDGSLRELRIWGAALSQPEIIDYANSELFGKEKHLVNCWRLNEGKGKVAFDIAGNNDGQIQNAQWSKADV